ncbi:hypothetical protein GCK72_013160 [Caenorhabditis remanei]|uniref:C2H2-type domain-containing protein n=1 Tax=Caenorhabditis remanei TaxID=31234 RepID=A0A6A5GQA1_CAERE|nr:hypothetical protein GCK72_013160 [Caenorhabditis remanei]KAF1756706.1 hypothetical protein GCK72_013160 [Caenorhabditis remanei]
MVSTHSSQYITDFTPTTAEPGKSPLALLAKTCETIGLPENSSSKKSGSPQEKKDEKPSSSSHRFGSLDHHQQQQSKKSASPRSTPQSKEPTLTFPGLPKPQFPMGMPGMGFPFFNPMMSPYQMPGCFPGAFPMAHGFMGAQRMPCPFAMMRQPCANPGCMQCPSSSNAVKSGQMNAEMMAQFAAHPLFSMYAQMMPNMTGVPPASYQALLAASAAASSSASNMPTDYSKPSTSTATSEPKTVSPKSPATSKPKSSTAKYQCNWVDSDVPCGKSFEDESELTNHVKKSHAPSPSSSASSEQSTSGGKAARSATSTPQRFNPYGKAMAPQMMLPPGMSMNPMVLPFSLQAMYSNRLMPTVAHQ